MLKIGTETSRDAKKYALRARQGSRSARKRAKTGVAALAILAGLAGFQSPALARMGAMIESAPLAPQLSLPEAGKSYRILYTSTDGVDGKSVNQVSGAVFYPAGPAPAGGWPIVAWAHGTVGVGSSCAPSENPRTSRDTTYLTEWLRRGFVVVASDYQGLGSPGTHPYLNLRAEAYGVLDAVHAALAQLPDLSNKVLIVGQSQGAGGAFAAAAYAPAYAPDLHVVGTVATGIPYINPKAPPQLTGQAIPKPDPLASYMLLLGASQAGLNPAFDPKTAFTDRAMPYFDMAKTACVGPLEEAVNAAGLDRSTTLQPTALQALKPALTTMIYPTLKLKAPIFIGIGGEDVDVATAGQLALVKDACAAGTTVQAHLYKGLGHSPALLASLQDSGAFTSAVMKGETVTPVCAPTPQ